MPRTGTTLCHPKIGYVNAMLLFRSRHLAINSPLGHFNGDNAYSPLPKYHTHKTHGDIQGSFPPTATCLSLNYNEHNLSHVRRHALPSQPSQLPHNSISSLHSQPFHKSCSTNTNYIFHAANKTYSYNISTIGILIFIIYLYLLFKTWRGD